MMMDSNFARRMKLGALSVLVIITSLGYRCSGEQKGDIDPSDPDGDGNGQYAIGDINWGGVLDCDANSITWMDIEPDIHGSYPGFNRVFFTLESQYPARTYRSNYVDFYPGNTNSQMIEFGGSIPTGYYWTTAYMANIQENSNCPLTICESAEKTISQIEVTECSIPQKTMTIEYSHQLSDTSALPSYDVFLSDTLDEYIDIAFNAANTTYQIDMRQHNLTAQYIKLPWDSLSAYIALNKVTIGMFLCGVKGFCDLSGTFIPQILGATIADLVTFIPGDSTGSLVAVKACIECAALHCGVKYPEYLNFVTIHELGHQRAIASDTGHTPFCVMNSAPIKPGTVKISRLWNPHFCPECINKLEGISW